MFESTRQLAERYFFRIQGVCPQTAFFTMQELRVRLRQLQFSYEQIKKISFQLLPSPTIEGEDDKNENKILIFFSKTPAEEDPNRIANLSVSLEDILSIYLEQFYYSSHKVMDLINDSRNDLKGLKPIKSPGITVVRNRLIEHTRKKNGNPLYSLTLSVSGPSFRRIQQAEINSESFDQGLWSNAEELQLSLNDSLKAGIVHHDAKKSNKAD